MDSLFVDVILTSQVSKYTEGFIKKKIKENEYELVPLFFKIFHSKLFGTPLKRKINKDDDNFRKTKVGENLKN